MSLLTVLPGPLDPAGSGGMDGVPTSDRRLAKLLLLTTFLAASLWSQDLRKEGNPAPSGTQTRAQTQWTHCSDQGPGAHGDSGQAPAQGRKQAMTEEPFSLKSHGHKMPRNTRINLVLEKRSTQSLT